MIPVPVGTRIWLVAGITDMRCGFQGLSAKVQTALVLARGNGGFNSALVLRAA